MRTHKVLNNISFTKVRDTLYIANIDGSEFNAFTRDIIESFTKFKIDKFSPLMDLSISEEIIARIIADSFLVEHSDEVKSSTTGIIVTCSMNEISYKVNIAYNEEKLGGFIYGVLS